MRYETSLPRLFRARGIAGAVTKTFEQSRKISVYRTYAPNRFCIFLSPASFQALRGELERLGKAAAQALEEARERTGFVLVGPLSVSFAADETLTDAKMAIDASFAAEPAASSPPKLRLRLLAGNGPAQVSLEGDALIGRDASAEVRIPEQNRTVSRRHARLVWRDGELHLIDLGGGNGTYVNGRKIKEQKLAPGDRIGVGDVDFLLERE